MNTSWRDDFKRDGEMSGILRRLADLENFQREFRAKTFGGGGGGDFTLIQDQVLGADAANFTFSAIPGTYKHLKLIGALRESGVSSIVLVRFNGDAGNNYSSLVAYFHAAGAFNTAESINGASGYFTASAINTSPANYFTADEITLSDYAATDKFKHWVSPTFNPVFGTATNIYVYYWGGIWKSTAAITSIVMTMNGGGNFRAGSRMSLYGIS